MQFSSVFGMHSVKSWSHYVAHSRLELPTILLTPFPELYAISMPSCKFICKGLWQFDIYLVFEGIENFCLQQEILENREN